MEIFVVFNGVYVDYIVFSIFLIFNWKKVLDDCYYEIFFIVNSYFGIGWGDCGFYLEVDEWANLKFSVVVWAMLIFMFIFMYIIFYFELFKD